MLHHDVVFNPRPLSCHYQVRAIGFVNIYMCQFPFDLDAYASDEELSSLSGYDYVLLNSQFSYQVRVDLVDLVDLGPGEGQADITDLDKRIRLGALNLEDVHTDGHLDMMRILLLPGVLCRLEFQRDMATFRLCNPHMITT